MKALVAIAAVCLVSISSFAKWEVEEKRIHFLIQSVESLDAIFIRNSVEYDAHSAAKHLRQKLDSALKNSNPEDWTAEIFIEKIASKSSLTGEAYLIRFHTGEIVRARDWLYRQLSLFP
jgi:hypothetical protein